jgi:hypothetical protein
MEERPESRTVTGSARNHLCASNSAHVRSLNWLVYKKTNFSGMVAGLGLYERAHAGVWLSKTPRYTVY